MAKVILISTRNVAGIFESISKCNGNIVPESIESRNLNEQLLLYKPDSLFCIAINNVTDGKLDKLKSEYDTNDLVNKIYGKADVSKKLNDILSSAEWWKSYNDDTWVVELIETAKRYFGKQEQTYSSTEHWNRIYKIEFNGDYIFIAHEYNKSVSNKKNISDYLNAIVTDICDILPANASYEWIFINHDTDWQHTLENKNEEVISFNELHIEYKQGKLKEILEKSETVVIAFQHTGTVNSKVIEGFNEEVITALCELEGNELLDYLEHTIKIVVEEKGERIQVKDFPLKGGNYYRKFAFPEEKGTTN